MNINLNIGYAVGNKIYFQTVILPLIKGYAKEAMPPGDMNFKFINIDIPFVFAQIHYCEIIIKPLIRRSIQSHLNQQPNYYLN